MTSQSHRRLAHVRDRHHPIVAGGTLRELYGNVGEERRDDRQQYERPAGE